HGAAILSPVRLPATSSIATTPAEVYATSKCPLQNPSRGVSPCRIRKSRVPLAAVTCLRLAYSKTLYAIPMGGSDPRLPTVHDARFGLHARASKDCHHPERPLGPTIPI